MEKWEKEETATTETTQEVYFLVEQTGSLSRRLWRKWEREAKRREK